MATAIRAQREKNAMSKHKVVSVPGRVAVFVAAHLGFFACLSVFLGN